MKRLTAGKRVSTKQKCKPSKSTKWFNQQTFHVPPAYFDTLAIVCVCVCVCVCVFFEGTLIAQKPDMFAEPRLAGPVLVGLSARPLPIFRGLVQLPGAAFGETLGHRPRAFWIEAKSNRIDVRRMWKCSSGCCLHFV